ncbi:unnamed protein product [Arabidopsis arenosa]|uniref:NYN domain-containing protein n=1 Tax=Arabidopsis arenosa TaxID=38785 RepID=A0A8S1ZED0_ARAAE|nr:unnamed protein product [Arabidopsis arenosa]
MMEPPTTTEAAEAAILVYWDMKMCPLPDGYDASRVGQIIERKLRQFGYNGPITITAVGILDGVPERALEALLSSGISLYNAPYGTKDVARLALWSRYDFPPPGNLMVISRLPEAAVILDSLSKRGYNTISPFPLAYSHPEDDAKDLWENFLLADTWPLEEDKCTKTGQSWVCGVCDDDIPGRGFQDFITHLSTQKHKLEFCLPNFDAHVIFFHWMCFWFSSSFRSGILMNPTNPTSLVLKARYWRAMAHSAPSLEEEANKTWRQGEIYDARAHGRCTRRSRRAPLVFRRKLFETSGFSRRR